MPVLKSVNESYRGEYSLNNMIRYVLRSGEVGGMAVDPEDAAFQMQLVKDLWYKADSDRRQVRQYILSFADYEAVDADEAIAIGYGVCRYFSDRFQVVFGLHLDTDHPHLHFAVNSVSYVDGRMYSGGLGDFLALRNHIQSLMPEPGWQVRISNL